MAIEYITDKVPLIHTKENAYMNNDDIGADQ
jgi:hypothetical protein